MKKSLGIALASLSLLLAGGALETHTANASNISADNQRETFTVQDPFSVSLDRISRNVHVSVQSDRGSETEHNKSDSFYKIDSPRLNNYYKNASDSVGGLIYKAGDIYTADKYMVAGGPMQGSIYYLINRPDLPNTNVWMKQKTNINDNSLVELY